MTSETEALRKGVEAYADTVDRIEPSIHPIDPGAFYASAAISLKRIADGIDHFVMASVQPTADAISRVLNADGPDLEAGLSPIRSIMRNQITLGDLRKLLARCDLPDDTPVLYAEPNGPGRPVYHARFGEALKVSTGLFELGTFTPVSPPAFIIS